MRCAEARRLLAAGIVPGAGGSRDPYLGFHLAGCDGCRALRDAADSRFLAALLEVDPAAVDVAAQRRNGFSFSAFTFRFSILAATLLLVTLLGWWFGLPVLRAALNVRAMYSPALPVVPVAQPTPSAVATEPVASLLAKALPSAPAPLLAAATPLPRRPALALAVEPTLRAGIRAVPTAVPPTPVPTPAPELAPVSSKTILLLGLDARPGEGLTARSDALMLARVDPDSGDVALLSLPRDLWTSIPGYGEGKVNAAFFFGESGQTGSGLQLAKQTVSNALNIPIDYGVAIDFAGFRSLVDTLGGISVDVPAELYDSAFPTDDYGYMVAHYLPGVQHMDGASALVYSRVRHPDSDFARMKRQQLVLIGMLERIRERGALSNLHEADTLTATLQPFVHTDIPPVEALALMWRLRDVDAARVRRFTVDGSMLYDSSAGGAYALVAPDGLLHAMGRKLLDQTER